MKKKFRIVLCIAILLIIATTYFLNFTRYGQRMAYDIFGGSNLHLSSDTKELYWFDVSHRNDPNSPIFKRIEASLNAFQPDLILVEGGYNTFEGTREESMYNGESAFATYLAHEQKISVEDIEPSDAAQIEYLQSKYPADHILAMYLIRQISSKQFAEDNSKFDFNKSVIEITQNLVANGLDYSGKELDDILKTMNSFLPFAINSDNWRDVDIREMNAVYSSEEGVLHPIYDDVYHFRNIHLVQLIREKKETYNRIYIVMGGQHLKDTKSQLEEIYTD